MGHFCTDVLDLEDSFRRWWYIRRVLLHGRAENVRTPDLNEVAALPDDLHLPSRLHRLWKMYLEFRYAE